MGDDTSADTPEDVVALYPGTARTNWPGHSSEA